MSHEKNRGARGILCAHLPMGVPGFALCLALIFYALPSQGQSREELAFAQRLLAGLQENSFAANREYCGMIGLDQNGKLVAARPRKGRSDSCLPRDPLNAAEIIASYHTHGAFEWDADSEVPSPDDVIGDMSEGVDGYVSTPGGRFWFIDGQTGVARLICSLDCLPQDPDFVPGVWGKVAARYTLSDLERRAEE